MSQGIKIVFLSQDQKIHQIPKPFNREYKPIPILSNQTVLMITICYKLFNSKPFEFLSLSFERVKLTEKGQYIITQETLMETIARYGPDFGSPEFPLRKKIPMKIEFVTINEIFTIKNYLKKRFSVAWENNPLIVEHTINRKKYLVKR